MQMGGVGAVRPPVLAAGIKPDDIIETVEVIDGEKRIRFGMNKLNLPGVVDRDLDPDMLPLELEQWAQKNHDKPRTVTFTLERKNPPPPAGSPEATSRVEI